MFSCSSLAAASASRAEYSAMAVSRVSSAVCSLGVLAVRLTLLPRMFCAVPLPSRITPPAEATVTLPVLPASSMPMVMFDCACRVMLPPSVFRLPAMITPS